MKDKDNIIVRYFNKHTLKPNKSFQRHFFLHSEWVMLSIGLIAMAFINPYVNGQTLCIFEIAGLSFCPGEGFGRSVALMVRGAWIESFQMHPLGIPGVFIIAHRICTIFRRNHLLKAL